MFNTFQDASYIVLVSVIFPLSFLQIHGHQQPFPSASFSTNCKGAVQVNRVCQIIPGTEGGNKVQKDVLLGFVGLLLLFIILLNVFFSTMQLSSDIRDLLINQDM